MLKQILSDMYVDPDILAGLDETQKQTLFCKMREEQIRRWLLWDENSHETSVLKSNSEFSKNNKNIRKVTFLNGEDGQPWVWIMGEHINDKSIEQILAEETQEKARQLAVIETKELRKTMEFSDFTDIIDIKASNNTSKKILPDEDQIISPKIEEMDIYCSVDELRERMHFIKSNQSSNNRRLANFNFSNSTDKRDILQVNNKTITIN